MSNSCENNGIAGYVNLPPTESGNKITFSDTTTSEAIFYQAVPFIGYSHVQGLYAKNENLWNKNRLLYLLTLFKKKASGRFDYAEKFTRVIAAEMKINLPVTIENQINFEYMEKYIQIFEEERISKIQAYLASIPLEKTLCLKQLNAEFEDNGGFWKEYKICGINGIFDVKNTHCILKNEIVANSGPYPYVTAGETDNSIATYISYDENFLEKGNSIMIGGKTLVITYQEMDFFSNDSHNLVLYVKEKKLASKRCQMFLVTLLYKALKSKYSWGDSISFKKIQNDTLLMPCLADNEPAFEYMEKYIQIIEEERISKIQVYLESFHKTEEREA